MRKKTRCACLAPPPVLPFPSCPSPSAQCLWPVPSAEGVAPRTVVLNLLTVVHDEGKETAPAEAPQASQEEARHPGHHAGRPGRHGDDAGPAVGTPDALRVLPEPGHDHGLRRERRRGADLPVGGGEEQQLPPPPPPGSALSERIGGISAGLGGGTVVLAVLAPLRPLECVWDS